MLIGSLILLLLIFIIFNYFTYNILRKCPPSELKINNIRASKSNIVSKDTVIKRVGIPSIMIKFDQYIPCGIYTATTNYGKTHLYVGNTNQQIGLLENSELNNSIDDVNVFDIWNIERQNGDDPFTQTYNNGCCYSKKSKT
jgi:hypothetical protein